MQANAEPRSLLTDLSAWKHAGGGGFREAAPGVIESQGGPGVYWFTREAFRDFVLRVEWRTTRGDDNSGVFIRCPPLTNSDKPAVERGYEIQIDDAGCDPERGVFHSPLHITGAIYALAPARVVLSRGAALWNEFEITARGPQIGVVLNGERVSELNDADREPRGHIGLQAHHDGSRVQFRNLFVQAL